LSDAANAMQEEETRKQTQPREQETVGVGLDGNVNVVVGDNDSNRMEAT